MSFVLGILTHTIHCFLLNETSLNSRETGIKCIIFLDSDDEFKKKCFI